MSEPLRIFIGYDSREPAAFHVLAHSILRRASSPVQITPLTQDALRAIGIYTRGPNGTTEFSLTRFLVPYLSGYEGVSIFMDCDMLVRCDVYDVLGDVAMSNRYAESKQEGPPAVYVCPHQYVPKDVAKATGAQTNYPRKNWSSFMVFANDRCRTLTPEYVNAASPADLHRLQWASNYGGLSMDFNWLVGEYEPNPTARILHYTLGTPCFPAYKDSDHAADWWAEYAHMNQPIDAWIVEQPHAVAAAAGYPVPPRTA